MKHPAGVFRAGLGYRRALHDELMALDPARLDFVELAPENYAGLGGARRRRLDDVRARWPIITHGLALSLGGEGELDPALVEADAEFVAAVESPHHTDHLCWSSVQDTHFHDLLPMPFTRAAARQAAERIKSVQSTLDVPFGIENVSAYLRRPEDELDEVDFISEVVELSGCKILLDVNNIYVNSQNFGADPYEMLARMPAGEAVQIHVAGFHDEGEVLIDTHGAAVADPVWPLLEEALRRTGPVPVLLERDYNIPKLGELMAEIEIIRKIGARVFPAHG